MRGEAFTYAFFIPAGYWEHHWHSADARVAVVQGELKVSFGPALDKAHAKGHGVGSFILVPKNVQHTMGATVDRSSSEQRWARGRRITTTHISINSLSASAPEDDMRIGVIGSGMIGSTLAELWVKAGHDVRLSSRHPNRLKPLVDKLGPRATAGTPVDAAQFGRVVLLAVPVKAIPEIVAEIGKALQGKVVLDAGNAYGQRDGTAGHDAETHSRGSAGWAASQFPESHWVKAFNTVNFKLLASEAHRQGDRIGIPLASDDADALALAAQLARDAGFDPVVVGGLERGKEFEPETRPYDTGMSGPELRKLLA